MATATPPTIVITSVKELSGSPTLVITALHASGVVPDEAWLDVSLNSGVTLSLPVQVTDRSFPPLLTLAAVCRNTHEVTLVLAQNLTGNTVTLRPLDPLR